jgi:iron(III) transport system substrate-binding protein
MFSIRLLKIPIGFVALKRLAATYCKYASARRFFARLVSGPFEQPATSVLQQPASLKKISQLIVALALSIPASATAQTETLDDLYKKALKEGGDLNFYGTLAQINAAKIIPVFEKRFPGLKLNHVDATADRLAARAITEARGGKVSADIFQMTLENILQLADQKLVIEKLPPEAAAYPDNLKGTFWVAADLLFITGAWNTNLVKKGEEPGQFEDFADPRWKGRLIAEPRDVEIIMGLAKHKYKSDEKAIALLKKIAANNVEFHKGHSQLAEFLVAGQAAACFTCYAHHYPPRIKKGAPL